MTIIGATGAYHQGARSIHCTTSIRLTQKVILNTIERMSNRALDDQIPKFIGRLMGKASETELCEATDAFSEYMRIVLRICLRLSRERSAIDSREVETRVD